MDQSGVHAGVAPSHQRDRSGVAKKSRGTNPPGVNRRQGGHARECADVEAV
jgi:hypothetical protein